MKQFIQSSSRTSHQVFLLLCASLYSTLVGCSVGYFVVPLLDRLGACATGREESDPEDIHLLQQQYTAYMEQAIKELSILTDQTVTVRHLVNDLGDCIQALRETSTQLQCVREQMQMTAESAKSAILLPQTMEVAVTRLHQICEVIAQTTEMYQHEKKGSIQANEEFRQISSEAFNELSHGVRDLHRVAESMRKNALEPSGRLVASMES